MNTFRPLISALRLSSTQSLVKRSAYELAQTKFADSIGPIACARTIKRTITDMGNMGWFPKEKKHLKSSLHYSGIIAFELERVDSSLRSSFSVQLCLVLNAILSYGSEYQINKWAPALSQGNAVGCFALTEADHGSNPANMSTSAIDIDGTYIQLNGSKMWITNAPISDVCIIWAKYKGDIRGFIVPSDATGVSFETIHNKRALQASITGSIFLEDVKLKKKDALLPDIKGLKGPFSCLHHARNSIGWGALGAAVDCYERALEYTKDRRQFGKTLDNYQLIQQSLSNMHTDIQLGLSACQVVNELIEHDLDEPFMSSMIKNNSCLVARRITQSAADLMGAAGILEEYHVMRHLSNLQAVTTYEGTPNMHTLIQGKHITGKSSF